MSLVIEAMVKSVVGLMGGAPGSREAGPTERE
jgi:hypothetical protein